VCLVDDRDRALSHGATLTTDEAHGPLDARAFRVTFGNGAGEMSVEDSRVDVPRLAEPLGYEITSGGVSDLGPSSRPTCV
jgi:hypothetical protein